ncbi:MAG: EamA family transporter RarD [Bacteroidetes bacterium]|nr:EamA family transporter RarD [Bacteroidota bacterium]
MNNGALLAVSAYLFWGLHPIYWKLLSDVSSTEIVAHRVIWSMIFFIIIITIKKEWKELKNNFINNTNKKTLLLTSFLIGSNWTVYVWAVNSGFIIETSLGYFISPLVIVLLGVIFLKERLRRIQWFALIIATTGVIVMTFLYGVFPWVGLYLAGTWGTYGMLRKKLSFSSLEGLAIETAILSVPAVLFMSYIFGNNTNSFYNADISTNSLLVGCGIITGLPLMIFIHASKKIQLSLLGILQYIYPTLIFIIGAFVYKEPLSTVKLMGFIFIWTALLIYSIEGLIYSKIKHR